MRFVYFFVLAFALLVPSVADAQTRGRRATTPPQKRRTTAAPSASANLGAINAGRLRVTDQVKKLTRFLYVYGRISKDFETSTAQAKQSDDTTALADSNQRLREILQGVRAELDQLENFFRTTPGLERYSSQLSTVAASAAEAEDRAAANQLDEAGKALVNAVNQLIDVLFEMS